jgi:hypothetical protein
MIYQNLIVLVLSSILTASGQKGGFVNEKPALASNVTVAGLCDYAATCSAGGLSGACVSINAGCCPGGTVTSGLCPGMLLIAFRCVLSVVQYYIFTSESPAPLT